MPRMYHDPGAKHSASITPHQERKRRATSIKRENCTPFIAQIYRAMSEIQLRRIETWSPDNLQKTQPCLP